MPRETHPRIAELRLALRALRRAETDVQGRIALLVARRGDPAELEELRQERERIRQAVEDALAGLDYVEAMPANVPVRGGLLLC